MFDDERTAAYCRNIESIVEVFWPSKYSFPPSPEAIAPLTFQERSRLILLFALSLLSALRRLHRLGPAVYFIHGVARLQGDDNIAR